MLSAYSWSQFGLFILVLLLLYYGVVGLLYYRAELTSLRNFGNRGRHPPTDPPAPLPLVRPTSAFAPAAPVAGEPPVAAGMASVREQGAAENLPVVTEPVVAGELPPSTAMATDYEEGASAAENVEATAAASAGQADAPMGDEPPREEADQVDERLADLVRKQVVELSEEMNPAPAVLETGGSRYEPLASFDEPVASPRDIIAVEPAPQLIAAESVRDYIALLQAGQHPPMPPALQGSCLAAQMAQHLDQYQAELAALFGADEL
ncbi:hypothetical protein GCM10027348_22080 [Hymenobacter tenuis]